MRDTLKKILRKIKFIIFNIKEPNYYAEKGHQLMENGNIDKSIAVLNKGLQYYPNSLLINREYAMLRMKEDNKKASVKYWNKVFKSKNKRLLTKEDYLLASKAYKTKKEKDKFISFINESSKTYKKDIDIKNIKIKYLFDLAKWNEVINIVESTYSSIESMPVNIRILLVKSYRKVQLYEKADYLLRKSLKEDKKNTEVALHYAEVAIEQMMWEQAITRYEYVGKLLGTKIKSDILVKLSMLYKIVGNHEKSKSIFNNVIKLQNEEKSSEHEIITLFDNGESRIDYYMQRRQTEKVVIVFDSLNMTWNGDPFGFKLLSRQNVDIIAVRKRKKKTYQQDLTQEDFNHTLNKLVQGYEDKIAYGHSLGGYLSLYYASNLNCRILSLAPRLSIHPKFGRKNFVNKYPFNHNESNNYNDKISPIVVYDPKSPVDNKYVNEEVLKKFPHTKLIEMPYAGHGVARHLLRMGVLKEYILDVIDGKLPKYDRTLKGKSANYCRLLGRECLKRNKIAWATKLAERAVELLPNERYVISFQLDVFRKQKQYNKAISFMKQSVELASKNLHVRLMLIDLYIEVRDLYQAEFECEKALRLLGTQKLLNQRLERIEKLRTAEIKQPLQFME